MNDETSALACRWLDLSALCWVCRLQQQQQQHRTRRMDHLYRYHLLFLPLPRQESEALWPVCCCLRVCVCRRAYLRNCTSNLHQFSRVLPAAVTRSCSGGVAMCQAYALPASWTSSCFHGPVTAYRYVVVRRLTPLLTLLLGVGCVLCQTTAGAESRRVFVQGVSGA